MGRIIMSIRLGHGFKVTKDGKVVRDQRAIEAKLNVSTRLKRRSSRKVRTVKRGQS